MKLINQVRAMNEGAGVCVLSNWAVITISGPDRKTFLHGMVTNEVNTLAPGQSNYALMLNAKGKILADLWVYMREDDICLVVRDSLGDVAAATLNKFLIMEDAEITDRTQDHSVLTVQGPNAEACVSGMDCIKISASLTGLPGFLLVCPKDEAKSVNDAVLHSGASVVEPEVLESMRIDAGVPIVGRELNDSVIPQEAGLHHAISFEKGCYIGQEVVARLHFRGHVNRELTRFILECDEAPDEVAVIHHDGKEVGKITSACRNIDENQIVGLGYLRSALRKAGEKYAAKIGDEEFFVFVRE